MERIPWVVGILALSIQGAAPDDREDLKAGRAALRRGDYATAERLLKSVADARPEAWDVRLRLLEAQLATGHLDEAEKTCRDYLFKHKDDSAASAALSRVKLARGDAAGALESAEAALKSSAADPSAVLARAEALAAAGRRNDAVQALEGMADLYKKRRDEYMKDGLFAIAEGLVLLDTLAGRAEVYSLAVDTILAEILRADNDPAVRAFLGHCHLTRHRREAAATCFNDALGVNSNLAAAHVGQGRVALEEGRFDAASESASKALGVHGTRADAHALAVRALLWKQDLDGAAAAAEKMPKGVAQGALLAAIGTLRGEAKIGSPDAHYETACALVAVRRFKDAVPHFEAAEGMFGARTLADLNRFRSEGKPLAAQPQTASSDALQVDLAKLFDRFEKDYATFDVPGFRVRVPGRARRWLEPWAREALEEAGKALRAAYADGPKLIHVIVSDTPAEIAALSAGVPGGGALGNVVAVPTPQPTFSWVAALWAGVTQAFELHRAGSRTLPIWALSGLGVHAARRAGFDVPDDWALLLARRDGRLKGPADAPAAAAEYDAGRGAWKEDGFLAWLDAKLARHVVELPPRPDDRRITDAESETKDAGKAVVAAADALARNLPDRAIKFARQAIAADAKSAQARSLLGQALQKRRKTDEAYDELKQAAALGAADYRTWYATGDVLEDLESTKEAIAAFEKAKAAFPRWVPDPAGENVYRRLIALHQRAKDADAEMRELAALMAFEPLNARDRKRLARHAEKDPDAALRWLREAAAVQPEDKTIYTAAAAALARKKEHARSIEMRLTAIALIETGQTQDEAADKAAEFCEIAEQYLALTDKDKAREYAKEALKSVPGLERAQRLYERATEK
jgi:Flp pilus assembly protein TadD